MAYTCGESPSTWSIGFFWQAHPCPANRSYAYPLYRRAVVVPHGIICLLQSESSLEWLLWASLWYAKYVYLIRRPFSWFIFLGLFLYVRHPVLVTAWTTDWLFMPPQHYRPYWLYFVAFAIIIGGLITYFWHSTRTPISLYMVLAALSSDPFLPCLI